MMHTVSMSDYIKNPPENGAKILIDIREKFMYTFGTVPGAVNIPLDQIRQLYELPKKQDIYIFCQSGEISASIAGLLSDAGYNVYHLTGGYREYVKERIQNKTGTDKIRHRQ